MTNPGKKTSIVVVDGCRIPFQKANTGYRNFRAHDLARFVIRGLLDRTGMDPEKVDRVIMGNVIHDIATGNVAREAALGAGLPDSVVAHTVSMGCLSSNQAVTSAAGQIRAGQANIIIAGGTDSVSGFLSRYPLKRSASLPYTKEFSTGESVGEYSDRMSSLFGISREIQDAYAVRSHQSLIQATEQGLIDEELVPVSGPPDFQPINRDNGCRSDSTPDKLGLLKPLHNRHYGTITSGNGTFHADGASAVLLMRESMALDLGLHPKARIKSWAYSAGSPAQDMLMGPAFAIPQLLDKFRIRLEDIDVIEMHEASSGLALSVLEALSSEEFARNRLGKRKKTGSLALKKLNRHGGSLSAGHPFAATGTRLIASAANRLIREKAKYALVAAGAAGGLGHAMLLESIRPQSK